VPAAVLPTGRRRVTDVLRTMRGKAPGPMSSSHRVLSQRRRSAWIMTCLSSTFPLDQVVPPRPMLLAGRLPNPRAPWPPGRCQGMTSRSGGVDPQLYCLPRSETW
jgi:hypothetical protein